MRPLHALILILAAVALLIGGLLWSGGSHASGTLEQAAQTPAAPGSSAPEAVLSSSDSADAQAARAAQPGAAVKLEGAERSKDTAKGLFGRVIGPDGKPVPGAKVFAGPADGMAFMPLDAIDPKTMPWAKRSDAVSDVDGRFALDLADQTHVRLAVRAGGFAPLDSERTLARGARDLGDVALEQGVVLEGRVVDQLGRPVAEAQLFSRPRTSGFAFEMMGRGRNPLATTDAQGHFRVDMLASGPWRMLVSSEEHPDKTFDGETEQPGAVARNLNFALEEGAQISGRVTGASTEVLAKLQVSAQQRAENEEAGGEGLFFGPGGFTLPRKAKVGADGSFVVRGLKPNQNYKLDAQKSEGGFGFGMPTRGGISAKSGDRGIEVPYTPSSAIVCQVVDAATGKPVTEMDVKAGYGWMMPLTESDGKPKGTFPDGNVRFDRLPPRFGGGGSGLKLRIDATGYKSFESAELTPVQGQDLELGVVRLEHAPVCRVQVFELATGQPVAGAEVSLREKSAEGGGGFGRSLQMRGGSGGRTVNDEGSSHGTTGADGSVVVSSFPGKQATLKVKHGDYAVWQSAPLTLPDSSDHEETVKLARGGEVLVTVQDSQGRPVAGVEIEHASASDDGGNDFEQRFTGGGPLRSDARGEVVFAHLEAGTHKFRLGSEGGGMRFVGGGGFQSATIMLGGADLNNPPPEEPWSSVEVLEGGQAPLKLIAPTRGSVVGRVREGGKPLAGASVRLEKREEGQGGSMSMPFFGGQDGPRSNGSGEYKCEGVKPGKYTMHVTHPSRAMGWEAELEVGESELRFDVDLPIAIVEGRITGPDGKPVVGARVTAERKQEKAEDRTMVFSFAVSSDEGGDAMTFGGSGGAEAQRTDADGRYTLRGLLTDTDLVVHVTNKDFTPTNSEKFRCAPDQTVRGIDVRLKQGGLLEVRVTRAGQPASGTMVTAYHKGKDGTDQDEQSEVTGPGGVAHFSGLEPGDWEFSVLDFSNPDANPDPQQSPRTPVKIAAGVTTKSDHALH